MYSLLALGLVLLCLGGLFEAVMDKINFHYDNSIFANLQNQQFYNPRLSWRNKYKPNQLVPKYPGSTTIFVALTDAWHSAKLLMHLFTFSGCFLIAISFTDWRIILAAFVTGRILFGIVFELTFKYILENDRI
jgi:hypothetical protein